MSNKLLGQEEVGEGVKAAAQLLFCREYKKQAQEICVRCCKLKKRRNETKRNEEKITELGAGSRRQSRDGNGVGWGQWGTEGGVGSHWKL